MENYQHSYYFPKSPIYILVSTKYNIGKKKWEDLVNCDLFNKLSVNDIIIDSTTYVLQSSSDQGREEQGELPTDEQLVI